MKTAAEFNPHSRIAQDRGPENTVLTEQGKVGSLVHKLLGADHLSTFNHRYYIGEDDLQTVAVIHRRTTVEEAKDPVPSSVVRLVDYTIDEMWAARIASYGTARVADFLQSLG